MMLNCVPIHVFSPEVSFVSLKLDLRVKWERRSDGMSEAVVFCIQNTEIGVLAFLLPDCVVCIMDRQWERVSLAFS